MITRLRIKSARKLISFKVAKILIYLYIEPISMGVLSKSNKSEFVCITEHLFGERLQEKRRKKTKNRLKKNIVR